MHRHPRITPDPSTRSRFLARRRSGDRHAGAVRGLTAFDTPDGWASVARCRAELQIIVEHRDA